MTEELPNGYDERVTYEKKILEDNTGCGTIYEGKYYHLDYQPARSDNYSLKCVGVELLIRKHQTQYVHDFPIEYVFFEPPKIGIPFFARPDPRTFQQRLAEAIEVQKIRIIKKEEHLRAVEEAADKVIKCQLKIDQTMKEVAGNLKQQENSLAEIDMVAENFKRIEERRVVD